MNYGNHTTSTSIRPLVEKNAPPLVVAQPIAPPVVSVVTTNRTIDQEKETIQMAISMGFSKTLVDTTIQQLKYLGLLNIDFDTLIEALLAEQSNNSLSQTQTLPSIQANKPTVSTTTTTTTSSSKLPLPTTSTATTTSTTTRNTAVPSTSRTKRRN